MRFIRSIALVASAAVAVGVLAAGPKAEPVQASLSAGGISYVHVSSGGRLALLGTAVHPGPTITRHQFAELLADDDGDGRIVFEPQGGIPLRSVWIGCDLGTGAVSVAAPEEYELDQAQLDVKALRHDGEGLVSFLEVEQVSVNLMLVRPGEGAWILRAYDGGRRDGDGQQNARLLLRPEDATPLAGITAAPPKKLRKGDVLIALDPFRMTVRSLTLTK